MTDDQVPVRSDGWTVLHLFCRPEADADADAIELAVKRSIADDHDVTTVAMLGHKADIGILALGPSPDRLRALQSELRRAGLVPTYSYVSLTELSEYSTHLPEQAKTARLRPELPPAQMPAFCFYPMTKRRSDPDNWYELAYERRLELMTSHGASGRRFAGRVVQLVTGSTGLDDFEWGVTLFARSLEDIKACVYTMRFDEASYRYAEFGLFLTGVVAPLREVLTQVGVR